MTRVGVLRDRRMIAATALRNMSWWIAEAHALEADGLPGIGHVSVALGFADAMRRQRLLGELRDGPEAALSMLAAVVSAPTLRSSPHDNINLLFDVVAGAEQVAVNRVLADDTTDVRLFMWRLHKLTQRLGSDEIAWGR